MGVAMFAGMAVVLGIIPIMVILIGLMVKFRNLKLTYGDLRVKLTNEVLSGIRILKVKHAYIIYSRFVSD